MRLACLMFGVFGLILMAGCDKPQHSSTASSGQPKYVANWTQLKVGMSKNQVRKLFGTPMFILRYNEDTANVPRAREFGDDNAALKADIEAIFGEPHVWQYGRFDIEKVSDEAYLVYFDAMGHVTTWRRPISGPMADTTQPIGPPGADEAIPHNQSPSELWNTPVLQPRK